MLPGGWAPVCDVGVFVVEEETGVEEEMAEVDLVWVMMEELELELEMESSLSGRGPCGITKAAWMAAMLG